MSKFSDTLLRANELGGLACIKAREQRSLDIHAAREYGKAAELVRGNPSEATVMLCVRNSIECFMRGQDWFAANATAVRWLDDDRLVGLRGWLNRRRAECDAKIAEET